MTTVINFPDNSRPPVSVLTFDSAAQAERYAMSVSGPTFVLGKLDARSLRVLSGPQLTTIYNAAHPGDPGVKRIGGAKSKIIERVLPLISRLASPGEAPSTNSPEENTMATRKKGSKKAEAAAAPAETPKGKGKSKKVPAPEAKGRGRPSAFAGQKLYKSEDSKDRRWHEGSRRLASFNAITNGMLYETALEKGAHKDDITIMVRDGVLEVRD